MNTPTPVADERAFQVDAERPRAERPACCSTCVGSVNGIGQPFQSRQCLVNGCRDRCRQIAGDAVTIQQLLYCRKSLGAGFHHIVAGATVNVDINETGNQDHIAQIGDGCAGGGVACDRP